MKSFLYTQGLQQLIYLYLCTDCFMKISLHFSGPEEWREIFMKQSVDKTTTDKLTSVIFV